MDTCQCLNYAVLVVKMEGYRVLDEGINPQGFFLSTASSECKGNPCHLAGHRA